MKHDTKRVEHAEHPSPTSTSEDGSNEKGDLQPTPSHGAGYDLNGIPIAEVRLKGTISCET